MKLSKIAEEKVEVFENRYSNGLVNLYRRFPSGLWETLVKGKWQDVSLGDMAIIPTSDQLENARPSECEFKDSDGFCCSLLEHRNCWDNLEICPRSDLEPPQ